nr:ATP synthase F0 subunit 8 [Saprochaete fungicola]QUV75095.1 ATP synthase F0 subunit 8 [Saprochaete fungicola]
MPQTVPFYFVNQTVYGTAATFCTIVTFSQYITPRIFFIFTSRIFITKT